MTEFDGSLPPREALNYMEPRPALAAWISRQIDVDGASPDEVAVELDAVASEVDGSLAADGLRAWANDLRNGARPDQDWRG